MKRRSRRAQFLLLLGMLTGLGLAMSSIMEPGSSKRGLLPEGVAAIVNGTEISTEKLETAVSALTADSNNLIGETERRHVLDRLIEEELLVQRALELGLDVKDKSIRNRLASAMIETIVAGVDQQTFSDEEVEAFFLENRDFFSSPGRMWVRYLRFAANHDRSDAEALASARGASARLRRGDPMETVAEELGGFPSTLMPQGLLPPAKIREYLGPTPTRAALGLKAGEVSDPIQAASAYFVLQMVARTPPSSPPLSAVEPQVRSEMRKRAGDEQLKAYLKMLRDRADIRLPPAESS
jgi:parvulin-like peptidyl-prolyl isomerase